jgi:hypothetical protein
MFFDLEVDGTYFNFESGAAHNALAAGQSWEIDEPGYTTGDIFSNFASGSLDNGIGISATTFPDDVSLALGWSFTGPAIITFTVSETVPTAGFYLQQHNESIPTLPDLFFVSTFEARGGGGTPSVPDGGATFSSLLIALGGLGIFKMRCRR